LSEALSSSFFVRDFFAADVVVDLSAAPFLLFLGAVSTPFDSLNSRRRARKASNLSSFSSSPPAGLLRFFEMDSCALDNVPKEMLLSLSLTSSSASSSEESRMSTPSSAPVSMIDADESSSEYCS
jgi:hypothetical protein